MGSSVPHLESLCLSGFEVMELNQDPASLSAPVLKADSPHYQHSVGCCLLPLHSSNMVKQWTAQSGGQGECAGHLKALSICSS